MADHESIEAARYERTHFRPCVGSHLLSLAWGPLPRVVSEDRITPIGRSCAPFPSLFCAGNWGEPEVDNECPFTFIRELAGPALRALSDSGLRGCRAFPKSWCRHPAGGRRMSYFCTGMESAVRLRRTRSREALRFRTPSALGSPGLSGNTSKRSRPRISSRLVMVAER